MHRESGQTAVETAIVMPLFVFVTLGLFQLMLMHQARLMTKYAAYKTVRAGALHRADRLVMEDMALAVLLPIAGDVDKDRVYPGGTPELYKEAWDSLKNEYYNGIKIAEVTICNPTSGYADESVDFDDPTGGHAGRFSWGPGQFDRTKLAIQVTFYYRLVIPFANGVLWLMVYGQEQPGLLQVLRTGQVARRQVMSAEYFRTINPRERGGTSRTIQDLAGMASAGHYILPIRASWTMRMQSNFGEELPGRNYCQIPWRKRT